MASLTSQLIISLIDRVSGPAKGVGIALRGVSDAEKKLASGGGKGVDNLASSLERAQKSAKAFKNIDIAKEYSKFSLTSKELRSVTRDFEALNSAIAGLKTSDKLGALRLWKQSTINDLRAIRAETKRTTEIREGFLRGGRAAAGFVGVGSAAYAASRVSRSAIGATAGNARENARDYLAGLTPSDNARLKAQSLGLSSQFPSVDSQTLHQSLRETATSFRSIDKAVEIGDVLAKGLVVLQSLKGKDAAVSESAKFFSALDTLGKNIDPNEVKQLYDGYLKALGVEGIDLKLGDLREIARLSKSAGPGLSDRFLVSVAPGLQGDLQASRLGTALGSTLAQVAGDRSTKRAKEAQTEFGLRDKDGFRDYRKILTDPDKYAYENLIPALQRKGISPDDQPAVAKALNQVFSNQVVSNLFEKLISQREQYQAKSVQYENAPGLAAAEQLRSKDPFVALEGFTSSFKNLFSVLGEGPLQKAVPLLNAFTDSIGRLTSTLANDPALAEKAGLGTGAAAAAGGIGGILLARRLYQWFTGVGAAVGGGGGALSGAAGAVPFLPGLLGLGSAYTIANADPETQQQLVNSILQGEYGYDPNADRNGAVRKPGVGRGASVRSDSPSIFGAGAKPVDYLDGSQQAAGAGQATGDAYKTAINGALQGVDAIIAAAVQRWIGMLSFSASPTITPNVANPPPQKHSSLGGNTSKQAVHADYGFGTTG
ncbi:MAG: hypothetical protein K2W78_12785 [Xanthobacteraceae bacterium]|nr:hypothetical protein [Xanthobacteraceae bacterium]